MENLRGNGLLGDAYSTEPDAYDLLGAPELRQSGYDDPDDHAPPPVVGKDERRMQVRAYNFWASLLGDRNFPDIADLDPAHAGDFGASSVLLAFSDGAENPRIAYLGDKLAVECDADQQTIERLSDVPSRSLLSRITDHYMQILANQAPIGFEAEFVNQRGATILYRGILLPYSSDNHTIDYIHGVINWKELADQQTADELLLEIEQQLEPAAPRRASEQAEIADWADGPVGSGSGISTISDYGELHAVADNDAGDMPLGDWLALAREQAQSARESDDRSRGALYEAIGRAWDFAIAAAQSPEEFAEIIEDAGLTKQDRAPMTPVVKLVFGATYDKTRLTEYASALAHAGRIGLGQGMLADYLREADGGLKGVVAAERGSRREEAGFSPRPARSELRKTLAKRLRSHPARGFDQLAENGAEFGLVMVRRTPAGLIEVLGEVPAEVGMIERAARQLLG